MEQKSGEHLSISVVLLGAYSAVLFDVAFSLTERRFMTNARSRIFSWCKKVMQGSLHLKNAISHSALRYLCICKNMHTVPHMALGEQSNASWASHASEIKVTHICLSDENKCGGGLPAPLVLSFGAMLRREAPNLEVFRLLKVPSNTALI